MLSRIPELQPFLSPEFSAKELKTESDVEQKQIFPFLVSPSYLGIPVEWIRTKEYMTPTQIDKAAGRRFGYYPDYSIWVTGIPLMIGEAKEPGVKIEQALREARLYADQVNKRYPPGVNPIGFVFASNGLEMGLSSYDSEVDTLIAPAVDIQPNTNVLDAFLGAIGKYALEERAKVLSPHFTTRRIFSVASAIGGEKRMTRQLGVNEFADPLFPILTRYFDDSADTPQEIIDRAYVTSEEMTRYEGILETYLKDRTVSIGKSQLKTIETSKTSANAFSNEIGKFANQPSMFSRVQIVVGSVGSGKSTFIRRYYAHLMSEQIKSRTVWAFVDFNNTGSHGDMNEFVASQFLRSIEYNGEIDVYDEDILEKILAPDLNKFNKSNRTLREKNEAEFERRKADLKARLIEDSQKFAEALARYFAGDQGKGLVVVFDNVDKLSTQKQIDIFESAQWFKNLTKSLVIVNLRDVTFEAHRDEKPFDAFINAINFYIRPPRFAQVIRKRLELLLEMLPSELSKKQEYTLKTGQKISYNSTRLSGFVIGIYASLFDSRDMTALLEALVAKDVRRALGMFSDIILSPHISGNRMTTAALTGNQGYTIPEYVIVRALMRGRHQYFNGQSKFIHDIISADPKHNRPSNFLKIDIIEFLVRNRKERLEFNQEGYFSIRRLIKEMNRLGYDESDAQAEIFNLIYRGMIEPESFVETKYSLDEPVRAHASGLVHSRLLLRQTEYIIGSTTMLHTASKEVSSEIGEVWASWDPRYEMSLTSKVKILKRLRDYLHLEYHRRCKRHAFYEDFGFGGRHLLEKVDSAYEYMESLLQKPRGRQKFFVPSRTKSRFQSGA